MRESEPEFDGLTGTVDNAFGKLVMIARAGNWTQGNLAGGERDADTLWGFRDDINKVIRECIDGVSDNTQKAGKGAKQFMTGVMLPVNFVIIADEWRTIGDDIAKGYNAFTKTLLIGLWTGPAAATYNIARTQQELAFKGMMELAKTIAENLEKVAKSVLTFYGELAKNIAKIVAAVIKDIAGLPTDPAAPFKLKSILSAITTAGEAIVAMIASILSTVQDIIVSGNIIGHAGEVQIGVPNATWPSPNAKEFGNMSVKGDTHPWQIVSDR